MIGVCSLSRHRELTIVDKGYVLHHSLQRGICDVRGGVPDMSGTEDGANPRDIAYLIRL